MSQLSLFSADLTAPLVDDLGGLLAAHGVLTGGDDAARLEIELDEGWRAEALARECRVRDVQAEIDPAPDRGGTAPWARGPDETVVLRTERSTVLATVARAWTQGSLKTVPVDLAVGPGLLRCWTIAAGRRSEVGYLLGLDPAAAHTFEPLAAACARAGLAGSLIGIRTRRPAMRIVGHRRCLRLAQMVGSPPPGTPVLAFPSFGR